MQIDSDKWIGTTCDIADQILRLKFGKDYAKECLIFEDDRSTRYTEKAQNIFNNILDDVEVLLGEQGIEQEEI